MSAFRDPPRLIDHAADPELREALRAIDRDTPSPVVLALLAERAQAAVQHSPASGPAHATKWTSALKLTLVTCTGAAILYGSLRAAERRTPEKPALAAEMREAASSTPRVDPVANRRAEPSPKPTIGRRTSDSNSAVVDPPAVKEPVPAVTPGRSDRPLGSTPVVAAKQPRAHRSSALPAPRAPNHTEPEVPALVRLAGTGPSTGNRAQGPALPSELQLLESAQRALAHDPLRSLGLLSQHRSRYPEGAFAQERDVLELEVLSRLGRVRDLKVRAQTFLERNPRSPHKSRIETLQGESSSNSAE
jgi:hypothetical protein